MSTPRRMKPIRNRLHLLLVLGIVASLGLMACQLATLIGPVSPGTEVAEGPQVDSDEDGVPSAGDNCPLTPNPDQAKSETQPIGKACENLLPDGMAIASTHGVIQIQLDSRGRPTRIATPAVTVTIEWPEKPGALRLNS